MKEESYHTISGLLQSALEKLEEDGEEDIQEYLEIEIAQQELDHDYFKGIGKRT